MRWCICLGLRSRVLTITLCWAVCHRLQDFDYCCLLTVGYSFWPAYSFVHLTHRLWGRDCAFLVGPIGTEYSYSY
ncbi:hypothetical protein F5Y12DRAFT_757887 [Xylaria sp. FL1777]|nr:hypothetical protein F5Y12DRAFT_757887 [Xylaria sp. FL1777]